MGLRDEYRRHSRRVTSTRRWKLLRLKVFERDGWACVSCGSFKRLECDHIEPVRDVPERAFDMANLQSLCRSCHSAKTNREVNFRPISPERQAWRELLKEEL